MTLSNRNNMITSGNKLQKRTLLYLASGGYISNYENLPYDKVILVDSCDYNVNIPLYSKCEFWNMDVLEAVDEIAKRGLMIDCLVSVNEGLFEGGGDYIIFSEFLLGYLNPFLADELLIITDLDYYGAARVKKRVTKMDWGYEKIMRLTSADVDYIPPSVFSYERRMRLFAKRGQDDYGHVYLLSRNYQKISKKIGRLEIKIIHGSIWQDRHQLDAIGLSILKHTVGAPPTTLKHVLDFFYQKPKVFPIRNLSMQDILNHCCQNNIVRIGLTPWMDGVYKTVFDDLYNYRGEEVLELSFYHLNKDDYRELYTYFGEYFLLRYPQFFEQLKRYNILWATFEEVLNNGYGAVLLKLCEQIAFYTKQNKTTFHFTQIKMKLGKLRIYSSNKNPYIKRMVRLAEELCKD
jgi:hypothetical protein